MRIAQHQTDDWAVPKPFDRPDEKRETIPQQRRHTEPSFACGSRVRWSLTLVEKETKMSDAKKSGWVIASVIVLVIDVLGLTLLAITTTVTRIMIAQIYQDMGPTLPRLTQAFLSTPSTVYIGLFGVVFAGLLAKEIIMQRKKTTVVINLIGLAAGAGFWLLFVMAIFAPMLTIVESLGKTH